MTTRRRTSHPRLRGVIFDLGGTLIAPSTTDDDGIRHLTGWLIDRGWPEEVGEAVREARRWLFALTGQSGRQVTMREGIRRALGRFDRPVPHGLEETAEQVFFALELAGYRPFDHAAALLGRLRAEGVRAGCISNATSHWLIEQIVDRMGFRPYLEPVVSSAGYGRVKPDAGIFRSVLDRWGIPPERAAVVGDTLAADIAGGLGLGMRTLYVTMTPNPDNVNHPHIRAEAEAATLQEAERLLLGWAGVPAAD